MAHTIRVFEPEDTAAVVALWEACGLTRPWNDPRADITRKLTVQPELFLVAVDAEPSGARTVDAGPGGAEPDGAEPGGAEPSGGESRAGAGNRGIVGSVMAGYDGHRGWLYYLASAPTRRGEGIGRDLTAAAEAGLLALGCPKAQLMVRSENDRVVEFYDGLGYSANDVLVRGKRLIED